MWTLKIKLGARPVVTPPLEKGDIDVYVEYVGRYLTFLGGEPSGDLDASHGGLQAKLEPKGLIALKPSPAEDKNVFVVTKATADKFKLVKISDLATITGRSSRWVARPSARRVRCASVASCPPTA